MNRLIVVSNRVQPPMEEGSANQGGLAVALSAALRESNGIWFGWSGDEAGNFTGHIDFQRHHGVTTATIDLEAQDIDEYYNGYANRTLWPLFHDRIDLAEFQREFEGGYERANRRFADTLSPLLQPDDLIWIHDYHLIPLGRDLRRMGVGNRLGFFLHIPWPPTRLLLSLPHHRELVESLFFYDVVGFQTQDWLDSFLHYVQTKLNAEVREDGTILHEGRVLRAIACPIGIDRAEFQEMVESEEALVACRAMEKSADGRAMILGVDRLDYSKGLQDRFLGYQRFLATHPEMLERVFLLQIAPPSRENVGSYQEIRAQLDALSGHINGEFASVEWVPIRYVNKGYPREKLAGIYRAARVGLVTPLRDGMNLVAKEYIAAQNPEDPGVLILSSFAGAARQLTQALLVNPHSADDVADAIARALTMPKEERIARWRASMDVVEREDVTWWLRRFVGALSAKDEVPATVETAG
ncbi:MAG: trehalose-6-phosphate synthase [Sphingobium sp.]